MQDKAENLEQKRAWEFGVVRSFRRLLDIAEGEIDAEGCEEEMPFVVGIMYHECFALYPGIYDCQGVPAKTIRKG